MNPAKGRGCGKDDHVTRAQAVHRILVRIKANELAILRDVDRVWEQTGQSLVACCQTVLKHVSHGNEADRAVLDGQCVPYGTGASATAADQADPDCVVLRGVNMPSGRAYQGRSCGGSGSVLQKASSGHGLTSVHGTLLGGRDCTAGGIART